MAGHGDHEGQGKIGLEVAFAAVLHTDEHRPQERQAQTDPADGLAPWQQAAQQAQQQTAPDRRQRDGQQRPIEKNGGGIKGAEQQLMVQQRQREKYPVQRDTAQAGKPAAGKFVLLHGYSHLTNTGEYRQNTLYSNTFFYKLQQLVQSSQPNFPRWPKAMASLPYLSRMASMALSSCSCRWSRRGASPASRSSCW